MPCILLTGATGYIASHMWLIAQEAGFDVIGVDSLVNSSPRVLDRLTTISGREPVFVQGDVRDAAVMDRCFELARERFGGVQAVVHFAALKAVGESVERPLDYFDNNLGGLLSVCQAMQRHGVFNLVFSSSATVYGQPERLPITEDSPLRATNPYGQTKLIGEELLRELERCDPRWHIAYLRYFNPVGAHPSGLIGEDPQGTPNNLMPFVAQVAVGRRPHLNIFGNDYATPDGTGVRDYIHVMDLSDGHVAALEKVGNKAGLHVYNLGTGNGYSVLEMVKAFETASGKDVPYQLVERRPGDIAECWADPSKAMNELGWKASRTLEEMTGDTWRWQSNNPQGYPDA